MGMSLYSRLLKKLSDCLLGIRLSLNVRRISGPRKVSTTDNEVVLLCVIRDGIRYVRPFLRYYRSLGIKHFFFLDNGSTDGTVEALTGAPDITLLSTTWSYRLHEMRFRHYLSRRVDNGTWLLSIDIDEFFDYPDSEILPFSRFIDHLNTHSYTAVASQLLDMFPPRPFAGSLGDTPEKFREKYRYYDLSNVQGCDCEELREWPTDSTCWFKGFSNQFSNPAFAHLTGGIRLSVFGTRLWLTGIKLVRKGPGVQQVHPHFWTNLRVADVSAALLHYRFLDDAAIAIQHQAGRYPDCNTEYEVYRKRLSQTPELTFWSDKAVEFVSCRQLVNSGFLFSSADYDEWVKMQQNTR